MCLFNASATVGGAAQAYYARETDNLEAALSARRESAFASIELLADPSQVQLALKEESLGRIRLLTTGSDPYSYRSRAQSRALDSSASLAQLASQAEFFASGPGSSAQRSG